MQFCNKNKNIMMPKEAISWYIFANSFLKAKNNHKKPQAKILTKILTS